MQTLPPTVARLRTWYEPITPAPSATPRKPSSDDLGQLDGPRRDGRADVQRAIAVDFEPLQLGDAAQINDACRLDHAVLHLGQQVSAARHDS